MTKKQQMLIDLIEAHKNYVKSAQLLYYLKDNTRVCYHNYIQVTDNILEIAQLFGAKIFHGKEGDPANGYNYEFSTIIRGVQIICLLSELTHAEEEEIEELLDYESNYNSYFSLDEDDNFEPTIKDNKYHIEIKDNLCREFLGNKLVAASRVRSFEDYCDEVVAGGNECAYLGDSLINVDGKKYLIWGDSESNENFITEYRGIEE